MGLQTKLLVLKQAWNRTDSRTEKEILGELQSDYVGRIIHSAKIGGATIRVLGADSPDLPALIRKGLNTFKHHWSDGMVVDLFVTVTRRYRMEDYQPTYSYKLPQQDLTSRVLTRTVMETYGWPIQFFSSLEELITVMRDTIQGEFVGVYFMRKSR